MLCILCKQESDNGLAVCSRCVKLAQSLLQAQSHARPKVEPRPQLGSWRVEWGPFVTIVEERDAASEQEALKIALDDTLQPWYNNDAEALLNARVVHITRNEHIDWLRRHT